MTGLFIRLYLDEDVSLVVKQLLMSRGHDVLATRDSGNLGSSDAAQLAFAAAQGRAIVTHNHGDFEVLAAEYLASQRHHSGIIVSARRAPRDIARRLLRILDDVTAEEMSDLLLYI